MRPDEELELAIAKNDKESVDNALARLQQYIVEAIQSDDADRLQEEEDALTAFLRPHRSLLYGERHDKSLAIGKAAGFHAVLRSLREDKPSVADLAAVRTKAHAENFLLALRERVALRAKEILTHAKLPHQSTVSEVGAYLVCAGLVSRDRTGKGATYRLTLRGNLVAKHLSEEGFQQETRTSVADMTDDRAPMLSQDAYVRDTVFPTYASGMANVEAPELFTREKLEYSKLSPDVLRKEGRELYA